MHLRKGFILIESLMALVVFFIAANVLISSIRQHKKLIKIENERERASFCATTAALLQTSGKENAYEILIRNFPVHNDNIARDMKTDIFLTKTKPADKKERNKNLFHLYKKEILLCKENSGQTDQCQKIQIFFPAF